MIYIFNIYLYYKNISTLVQTEKEKKEEEWYDVGVTQESRFTVQHYYLPGDDPLDITQPLTMDVFEGRTKVPLEQGTIYKLRIAAVNSCGQSDWSEVNRIIANNNEH